MRKIMALFLIIPVLVILTSSNQAKAEDKVYKVMSLIKTISSCGEGQIWLYQSKW